MFFYEDVGHLVWKLFLGLICCNQAPFSRQLFFEPASGKFWPNFDKAKLDKVSLGEVRLGKVRLGKVRLGKVRLGKVRLGKVRLGKVYHALCAARNLFHADGGNEVQFCRKMIYLA